MSDNKQPTLIPKDQLPPQAEEKAPPLTGDASIQAALGLFETHMRDEGFALNTVKAFASDVRLLGKFLGIGQPIGEIGTKNLNDFMHWLLYDRGVPCSPKSYARRVTTLKVFFGWLHKAGVLAHNPAVEVIQRTVKSPLPTLPAEADIEKALVVAQAMRQQEKPDARPHLLLTLLLQTGIKKSEAMNLVPNHIDRDAPGGPLLFVRYANPRLRNKERKLYLETEWLSVLDEYLEQYKPHDTLFTCTARNLEYVLRDVGDAAELKRGLLSFENLRWISALRDHKADIEPDEIRQKLGLSKITWRETKKKLERLAKGKEKIDE
ncbi:MAG: site-specific integrase [Chloroflexi bacterium]|nr:site-specific integrase [Chloroflexota bacterium]